VSSRLNVNKLGLYISCFIHFVISPAYYLSFIHHYTSYRNFFFLQCLSSLLKLSQGRILQAPKLHSYNTPLIHLLQFLEDFLPSNTNFRFLTNKQSLKFLSIFRREKLYLQMKFSNITVNFCTVTRDIHTLQK
jgi:hypothetical protein